MPNALDNEAYENVKVAPPTAESHPNLFAWFCLVMKFTDAVRHSWAPAGGAAAGKQEKKPAATK